jgi:outer membrane lipoprotein-sorting protein
MMGLSPAGLTPKEILSQADEARGNLEGIKWELHTRSIENDRKQERHMEVKARGYDFLAILISPSKVKGQRLLSVDHNMWFAKPGLRKPVPVSPRQKLTGGASNGDIAATNYANDYDAELLGEEPVDGEPCYVYDLESINKKATYDRIKYWVSKERLVGVKAEFFTVSGKMFKSARFEYKNQVKIDNEERLFISRMIITDALVSKNVTTLDFKNPVLEKLPDATFNVNFLRMR